MKAHRAVLRYKNKQEMVHIKKISPLLLEKRTVYWISNMNC